MHSYIIAISAMLLTIGCLANCRGPGDDRQLGSANIEECDPQCKIRLPLLTGDEDRPVLVAYNYFHRRRAGYDVIFAAWKDGRVIWSDDPLVGGAPYKVGRLDDHALLDLQKVLERLVGEEMLGNPVVADYEIVGRGEWAAIAVCTGSICIQHKTDFELAERTGTSVVLPSGHREMLRGKAPEQILQQQPLSYREFRSIWRKSRELVWSLAPENGDLLHEQQFRERQ